MKVVAVLGSPHKNGPSSTIARAVLKGAQEAGHEVVVYELNEMNVRGCQACGYCKSHWSDCILDDDLKPYWKDLQEAGALVLAAPNYCSQINGPMITYMNRHYCLMMRDGVRIHPGIKVIGVFSQGGPDPERAMPAYKWFLGDFEARKMVVQDIIVHTSAIPWDENSEIIQRAIAAGKAL